jgi:COP9 signalosome complex subunit 8
MDVENFISTGDFDGLASYCEEAELMAPQGIASPQIYGSLLAVYLLQNELDHAKLLWKRMPGSVKASNPEIGELWEIGKKLWNKSFPEIYQTIDNTVWPSHIIPLLTQLIDKVRCRVIQLVGKSYSNISLNDFSLMLGLKDDATLTIVNERGWDYDESTRLVIPRAWQQEDTGRDDVSQDKLARLVDIVSFLEN